ncbi:MAG: MFS transporter [Methylacidiphilales bacterium]|nr:MFS transporter [Candidatus Methylacidiphilales bacterium]
MNQKTTAAPLTGEEKKVIFASSVGTIFEWYDFYLYGSLAVFIAAAFFSKLDAGSAFIFTLLAFAAGFIVRPFGALIFGRLGDMIGRKYTFLLTIIIMGISTFAVGLLPTYDAIGILAPILLITLRMLQGLALGGEYGGAAIYVTEHAQAHNRGYFSSFIQTTATLGLFMSLLVILGLRTYMGEDTFKAWGWRVPFLLSFFLFLISLYVRLKLNESPAFKKMKEEGKHSKAPLSEAFGKWSNLKIVIIALLGLTAGQAVVWYTGQFYALFFLTNTMKVDGVTANWLIVASLAIGTPFFIIFGILSDKIGRKPIILTGCLLAALTYIPIFKMLANSVNPDLYQAQVSSQIKVYADPEDCNFQFNPTGTAKFTNSCDIAKQALSKRSVSSDTLDLPAGSIAYIEIAGNKIESYSSAGLTPDDAKAKAGAFDTAINNTLINAGYPTTTVTEKIPDPADPTKMIVKMVPDAIDPTKMVESTKTVLATKANPEKVDWIIAILILSYLVILVTMVYGPIAAALVELFPTRIRYTSLSLPYHIGNGWFGGLLPATSFAIAAQTGNIYSGLWYPICIAAMTFVIGMLFIPETKDRDIYAED